MRLNLGAGLPVPVLHEEREREGGWAGLRRQEVCVCEIEGDGWQEEREVFFLDTHPPHS